MKVKGDSMSGFIILFIIITLFDSTFCKLYEYKLEEHVKIVSHKTKVYLAEEWRKSYNDGLDMSKNILSLLDTLYNEYLFLDATYQTMLDEHSEASRELNEIIEEHEEEESEIAACIERTCMLSVKNCRFRDVTNNAMKAFSLEHASTVTQLQNRGISVDKLQDIETRMIRALADVKKKHDELENRRSDLEEFLDLQTSILRIVDENEESFQKILGEAERKAFRDDLTNSKEEVLKQIEIFQNVLSSNDPNQKRRRRALVSESGGYVPVLRSVGPADCDEVEAMGGWRNFCSVSIPKQCSNTLADHVDSLAKNFTELNSEIRKKQMEFEARDTTFNTLYAHLNATICEFMKKIVWLDMAVFTDRANPKCNVIKLTFDPANYSLNSGDLLYNGAIATVEGWKNLEGIALGGVNVHKYYATAYKISNKIRETLQQQACLTGPRDVKNMLNDHCPHLCKIKRY